MYECKKCNYETDKVSDFANHCQYYHKENKIFICEECKKEFKNEKGFKCHTKNSCEKQIIKNNINHICSKCNTYISSHLGEHFNRCDGNGSKNSIIRKEGGRLWALGKKYDDLYGLEKSKLMKEKLSNNLINNPIILTTEKENIRRDKIRINAKKKGYGGYIKGSGRGKSGWYKKYWCDSSWELAFVIFNLEHDILFKRNTEKFNYDWNNETHYWIPDFIINNIYYEIKGYWTDQNQSKFDSFKKPLVVLYEKEMLDILNYVINKYGKNYIDLYDNMIKLSCVSCGGHIYKHNQSKICIKCKRKKN